MHKLSRALACLGVPMVFSIGCTTAFRVHSVADPAKLDGIPFYGKTAKCLQTTIYLYPYYRITFQTLTGDKVLGGPDRESQHGCLSIPRYARIS